MKKEDPETKAEAEDRGEQQQQITAADAKDWVTPLSVLYPVAVTVALSVASTIFHTHFRLAILFSYVALVNVVLLTHLLLRHGLWRGEKYRRPLAAASLAAAAAGAVMCGALVTSGPRTGGETRDSPDVAAGGRPEAGRAPATQKRYFSSGTSSS